MGFSTELHTKAGPALYLHRGGRGGALQRRWRPPAVPSPRLLLRVAQHLHPCDLRARVPSGNRLEAEASTAPGRAVSDTEPFRREVLRPRQKSPRCPRVKYTHLQRTVLPGRVKRSPFLRTVGLLPSPGRGTCPPHPNVSMPDYLGRKSRSPALGPFRSPMMSTRYKVQKCCCSCIH